MIFLTNNRNSLPFYDWISEHENALIYSEKILLPSIQNLNPRLVISYNYAHEISPDVADFLSGKIIEVPTGNNEILSAIGDYSIREIQATDLKMLLEWRNSPRISSVMITDHQITWEEHLKWFCKIKKDPIKKNFIFSFRNVPIGYGGCSEFDEVNKTCSPSGYLGEVKTAPKDAGIFLWYLTLRYIFEKLGIVKCVTTIFADNKKALKLDKLFGYEVDEANGFFVPKNGQQKLLYNSTLTREHFEEVSHKLVELLQLENFEGGNLK